MKKIYKGDSMYPEVDKGIDIDELDSKVRKGESLTVEECRRKTIRNSVFSSIRFTNKCQRYRTDD